MKVFLHCIFNGLLCTSLQHLYVAGASSEEAEGIQKKRSIAVIGGGISGTFVTKYLSDYDVDCLLDSITIYEPYSIQSDYGSTNQNLVDGEDSTDESSRTSSSEEIEDDNIIASDNSFVIPAYYNDEQKNKKIQQQGPRVSSIKLSDGTIVELGASIIFSGNKYAVEMLQNDPENLVMVEPLSSDKDVENKEEGLDDGLGIYNGLRHYDPKYPLNNETIWPLYTANMTDKEKTNALLWRYNFDLYKISKSTDEALKSFQYIYNILNSNDIASFQYNSPNDLWQRVGLGYAASVSFDDLLDYIGVSKHVSWWRRWILRKHQGLVREELLTAMNICNNNKNNAQMTGKAFDY